MSDQPKQRQRGRAPDHQGTKQELPSGKFRYVGRVNGKRVTGSARKTLRDAKADFNAKVQAALAPAEPENPEVPCVEDYVHTVLYGAYKRRLRDQTLAPSTWQLYDQALRLNIMGTWFGARLLDTVTPGDVERWAGALMTHERWSKDRKRLINKSMPMANSSKARLIGMIGGFFEHARVKDKLILVNPVNDADKPEFEEVAFRILTATECEELLLLCEKEDMDATDNEKERERRHRSNRRRRLIVLLGLHGIGPSEMCGLRYEDFDGQGILPKRQRQRLRNLKVLERERLKTKQRKAWVAVDEELQSLLAEFDNGYVLENDRGGAMETGNLRRAFTGMVKGTKFEGLKPYDLRHTFGMRLIEAGVDVRTSAEMMRHTPEVFLRRYVRSDKERKIDAIRKLNKDRKERKSECFRR